MSHPSRNLSHVRNALYSEPWLIEEGALDKMCAIVESHAAGALPEFAEKMQEQMATQLASMQTPAPKRKSPLLEMQGSIAIISIQGPIFPKSNLLTLFSGATSLQAVDAALVEAMDNQPSALILSIDSPGGSATGAFEMADRIFEIRSTGLPVLCSVEGMAASLGYLLASQCDDIFISRGSQVGSVSAVVRIESSERGLKNQGVDSFTLSTGDMKRSDALIAQGGPVTVSQVGNLIGHARELHQMFIETVQRGREGKTDAQAIATGQMWIGKSAVSAGMADDIKTLGQLLNEMA